MTLVVDASVAFKWFLSGESDGDLALGILRDGDLLVAPDLVIAEVCNAAWKSARLGRITPVQVREIATALPRYFDKLVASALLATRAVEISEQLDHPVYDSLYLALAEAEQARVVTADSHLAGKVRRTQWKNRVAHLPDISRPTR